jgi:hypothetical protein
VDIVGCYFFYVLYTSGMFQGWLFAFRVFVLVFAFAGSSSFARGFMLLFALMQKVTQKIKAAAIAPRAQPGQRTSS